MQLELESFSLRTIVLQNETHITGHHVQEIWTSKQNEYLNENPLDNYAVCVLKGADIVGNLKKGDTDRFSKTIFYFLRSHSEAKCVAKATGKRCNQGDGKGLIVACSLEVTGLKNFVSIQKNGLIQ